MINKRRIGARYEDAACAYLTDKGMSIIDRNFRRRSGEIDIIARDSDAIVFCEVKYRKNDDKGDPLEAVDLRKQQQISKLALYYLMYKGYGNDISMRFDVVGIYGDGRIVHIRNAFEYCYR